MTAPAQGADLPAMAAQVKKDLQDAVGSEIKILDVRIPRIFYDQPTQQRIDAYNQKVQEYDTMRRQFPANLTAKLFGFKDYPYFQAPPEAKQVPKVNFKS